MRIAFSFRLALLFITAIVAAPVQSDHLEDDVDFGALTRYLDKLGGENTAHHEALHTQLDPQSDPTSAVSMPIQEVDHAKDPQPVEYSRQHPSIKSNGPPSYTPVPKRAKAKRVFSGKSPQARRDTNIEELGKQRAPLLLKNGMPAEDFIHPKAKYNSWSQSLARDHHTRLIREIRKHIDVPRRTLASRLRKYCTFQLACDLLNGDRQKVAAAVEKLETSSRFRDTLLNTHLLGSRASEIAQRIQDSTKLSKTYAEYMVNRLSNEQTASKLLSSDQFNEGVKDLRKEVPWIKKDPKVKPVKRKSSSPVRPWLIRPIPLQTGTSSVEKIKRFGIS